MIEQLINRGNIAAKIGDCPNIYLTRTPPVQNNTYSDEKQCLKDRYGFPLSHAKEPLCHLFCERETEIGRPLASGGGGARYRMQDAGCRTQPQ
jgi:hypothetical protein